MREMFFHEKSVSGNRMSCLKILFCVPTRLCIWMRLFFPRVTASTMEKLFAGFDGSHMAFMVYF